jgi:hemophore-related protein
MLKLSLSRLAVAVGGLALSLAAGAGVASADPDLDPIVNSTCTYPQWVAALNAQDPMLASAFNSMPETQAGLRQFLASPPDQRQQMAQGIASAPANQPYLPLIQQVFSTCNNY